MDMMEIRRRVIQGASDLPPGYQRVKCIVDTNGRAYIDLLRKFNSTHRYKFDLQFLGNSHDLAAFGARDQSTYYPKNSSLTWVSDYKPIFYCGRNLPASMRGYTMTSLANTIQEFQSFEIKAYDGTFIITNSEGRHINIPGQTIETGYEYETDEDMHFMSINTPGTSIWGCMCKARLYEEYDANDKLISRFIPCIRRLDNVAGMYDVIENVFYNSANPSVPFTAEQ